MSTIINILKAIGDFFASVVDFVIKLGQDLVMVVKLLAECIVQLPAAIAWLPGTAVTLLVALFAVVVIYKVLGREG